MSALYPSLEDMKVDQMAQAQAQHQQVAQQVHAPVPAVPLAVAAPVSSTSSLYPSLEEYMGLNLTPEVMAAHMPNVQQAIVPRPGGTVAVGPSNMVAPVTGSQNVGLRRANVTNGVREVTLCKDQKGKIGLRVRAISKGVFISFVGNGTPAAMGRVRFGDQVLQINSENCAGMTSDKAMSKLRKSAPERIVLALRDRPFERTITLQKDSTNHVGFVFKGGKITAIAKDTSAARNGLLIDHALLEVEGQNVIGMKDKAILEIMAHAGKTITLTIMPNFVFDHMMKSMATSLVKGAMDHSIPEV
ncbi:syntenin-1-like [Patiria miniata]|uniref:PDZ domain-containing protein n=1 Tax=Patiria miniata TaxID=46514 RepID=A0A914A1P0_PATMI|nr:syntenin-1-like [Patiria miniata]